MAFPRGSSATRWLNTLQNMLRTQSVAEPSLSNQNEANHTNDYQHNFYTEFQPEFELIVEESNGRVLQ